MSNKKILLFIVEGVTDSTCLGYALSAILNSNKVEFAITDGDITTRKGVNTSNVVENIGNIVREFSGKIFKPKDFLEVVHLVDIDGAYVLDTHIVVKNPEIPVDPHKPQKPYYSDDQIFAENIDAMLQRNRQKTTVLNRIISLKNVWRIIPYSVYFFSCNLDHVIHGERNLFEKDKYPCADKFRSGIGGSPQRFIDFINTPGIAVQGNYDETWDFIRTECNSLKRHTNFQLFFTNPKNPR